MYCSYFLIHTTFNLSSIYSSRLGSYTCYPSFLELADEECSVLLATFLFNLNLSLSHTEFHTFAAAASEGVVLQSDVRPQFHF